MDNPVALVTGASRGIGRAIAARLARDDYFVIIDYKCSQDLADQLAGEIRKEGGQAICLQADVANYRSVKKMIEQVLMSYGHIELLVNNAGVRKDRFLVMMDENDWDEVMNVNLKGVFNCSKLVAFEMIKRKKGKIINITSIGALMGTPGQANYVASKGGIISLTKTMARELAKFNILVNAVAPGFIDTDILTKSEKIRDFLKLIPLERVGKAEEVAELVSFIASDNLSYTTGHVFYVDGGLAM